MALFQKGDFDLYSGRLSDWGINCDAFTDDDWDCVANLIMERYPNFSEVHGPDYLEERLSKHVSHGGILIVDDVYFEPTSFEIQRTYWRTRQRTMNLDIQGFVVFAKIPLPRWIRALWQLDFRIEEWQPRQGTGL
jgi:hypothetical protein